jgi:hypothetical protein
VYLGHGFQTQGTVAARAGLRLPPWGTAIVTSGTQYTQSRGESPRDVLYRTHGGASET